MFSSFEFMVAGRYLRSKKSEGFVSVTAGFSFTGIMLGVATLIIVMSVMNGFRAELFGRILGLNGHMNVYALSGPFEEYDAIRNRISPLQGIRSVTPIINAQSLISKGGNSSGVMIRAMSREDFFARDLLRSSIAEGDIRDFSDDRVAIGKVIAEKMRLRVGDEILLTSPKTKATPFGSMPRQRRYTVGMIFDVEMYEYNSGFVFMPLPAAQTFFQMSGAVSALEIFLDDPEDLDDIREAVSYIIRGQAGIYDWRDMNASFFNALKVERNVMFLILTMIILVAAFNIISSMIMLVKDKGSDIAILRTMGATSTSMMKIFILTGASIGMIGTALGSALGIAFAMNIETIRQFLEGVTGTELFADEIYFLSQLPAVIDWSEVSVVICMAFALSILATLYPAWRAARLDPVEALRYE